MKTSHLQPLTLHLNLLTTTVLLLLLTPLTTASSFSPPPLFCKCTCGTNSTIIPLDERPPPLSGFAGGKSSDSGLRPRWESPNSHPGLEMHPPPPGDLFPISIFRREGGGSGGGAPRTCADCTRSFCLGYNLPFCKGVQKEEEVVTSCFARDGVMDRVLVWGFVVVTVGLLVWAAVRGWVLERVRGFCGPGGWFRGRGEYEGLAPLKRDAPTP
ncbi:hypothetical protein EV426DRAFT_675622 [Tirmania nivea]|nr:hypothetical protein EV426DRAFT_675622 [Tirmania nivea]